MDLGDLTRLMKGLSFLDVKDAELVDLVLLKVYFMQ